MFLVRILEWLWADYMLYDYFKSRFETKLKEFGKQRMVMEKAVLRNLSDNTLGRCDQEPLEKYCEYFIKSEMDFLDEIRDIQRNRSLQVLKSVDGEMTQKQKLTKLDQLQ